MGALLPCGSRDKAPPKRPVDLSAAWRRAAEVPPLPGPNEELEELLGEWWPGALRREDRLERSWEWLIVV